MTGEGRSVTILGVTGSVGRNTADLILRDRDRFTVEAVTANESVNELASMARDLGARCAVIGKSELYGPLCDALEGSGIEAMAGPEAIVEAADRPSDWLMGAISGAAGLDPLLTAIRRGAIVALANKEALICAGDLVMDEVAASGARLLPVDSEHNAIYQVFDFDQTAKVDALILTASGGPFRTWTVEAMKDATPEQAVAHPNWKMGAKISVDSATLMNKGLELIEAYHLFPVDERQIEIVVHPQSVIHSMVSYVDGSVLAQLGTPDMRTPIAYTLAWPARMVGPSERLNFAQIGSLTFEVPDIERFPALSLARQALQLGGSAPTILNAADEVAVAGFLAGNIGFLDIISIVSQTLERVSVRPLESLDDVGEVDAEARCVARSLIGKRC
ncbi:MAG: 1-deoxy-D-xylulose-5-phosphate reductoisomerase [Pseudomonadota bacterium]